MTAGRAQPLLELVGLTSLMATTTGSREVVVGLIDGPVQSSHEDLRQARIRALAPALDGCRIDSSLACRHGTAVAGALAARRGSEAPAICPGSSFVARPIFCEATEPGQCPEVTPAHLASAVLETLDAGAKIINMSLGTALTELNGIEPLFAAYDEARRRGALLVGAAGNHSQVGGVALFRHPWVIPVAASDAAGRPLAASNLGASVGRRGLRAPGARIQTLSPDGGSTRAGGTSMATTFVTGALALLWSLFPRATDRDLRSAVLGHRRRQSVVPPLLDAAAAWRSLQLHGRSH